MVTMNCEAGGAYKKLPVVVNSWNGPSSLCYGPELTRSIQEAIDVLGCGEAVAVNTVDSFGCEIIISEPLRKKRHDRYPVLRRKLVTNIEIKEISLKQNLFSGNVNDEIVVRMRVTTDINQFDGAYTVT